MGVGPRQTVNTHHITPVCRGRRDDSGFTGQGGTDGAGRARLDLEAT